MICNFHNYSKVVTATQRYTFSTLHHFVKARMNIHQMLSIRALPDDIYGTIGISPLLNSGQFPVQYLLREYMII